MSFNKILFDKNKNKLYKKKIKQNKDKTLSL